VSSKNLEHEEAKARYRAVKIQPQCVVTPGKQTNTQLFTEGDIFNKSRSYLEGVLAYTI
jgi:hypothetical protein